MKSLKNKLEKVKGFLNKNVILVKFRQKKYMRRKVHVLFFLDMVIKNKNVWFVKIVLFKERRLNNKFSLYWLNFELFFEFESFFCLQKTYRSHEQLVNMYYEKKEVIRTNKSIGAFLVRWNDLSIHVFNISLNETFAEKNFIFFVKHVSR